MKSKATLISILLLIFAIQSNGQIKLVLADTTLIVSDDYFYGSWNFTYEPVITDSIIWRTTEIDSLNLGKENCDHVWIYSKDQQSNKMTSCAVNHMGFHCSWDDAWRNRICSQCLRKETQREHWYQHRKKYIKTEYDKLEKLLKK